MKYIDGASSKDEIPCECRKPIRYRGQGLTWPPISIRMHVLFVYPMKEKYSHINRSDRLVAFGQERKLSFSPTHRRKVSFTSLSVHVAGTTLSNEYNSDSVQPSCSKVKQFARTS